MKKTQNAIGMIIRSRKIKDQHDIMMKKRHKGKDNYCYFANTHND